VTGPFDILITPVSEFSVEEKAALSGCDSDEIVKQLEVTNIAGLIPMLRTTVPGKASTPGSCWRRSGVDDRTM
jgi:hypothetical protein